MTGVRLPTVIVPYEGPTRADRYQDIFVYLRPETNGVHAESVMLKVIKGDARYREHISLVYLANLPGDFIVRNRVVEQHYATRLYFTRRGKEAFTASMKRRFADYFNVDFDAARILGAFEYCDSGRSSPNELFDVRVDAKDLFEVNGQTVKRIGDQFIINYDIPALLRKNNEQTDIAVMVFRSDLPYPDFQTLVREMGEALIRNGVLNSAIPFARAFHYSKGPFEQVLDGLGYLYNEKGERQPAASLSFSDYLARRGIPLAALLNAIRYPIMQFREASGELREEDLFTYTIGESFEGAYDRLMRAAAQPLLS